MKITTAWLKDAGERVASSAVESAVAAVAAGALATGINQTTEHVLLYAALTAAATSVKAILAPLISNSITPASLVPEAKATGKSAGHVTLTFHADTSQAEAAISKLAADVKKLKRKHRKGAISPSMIDVTADPEPKTGRKLGHLPSPRDDRDHRYKATVKPPTSVHNGAGLVYDPLGNLTVGDCAEAGEEHGRQIVAHLKGLTYTPTPTGTLSLYSKITGYRNGVASTDNGTVLRQMLADLKAEGVITEYQAVTLSAATLKAAITEHDFVLCGFALPSGAESEGVKWSVPRSGKSAGSWGGHCVPLCGYTPETFDLVSWGELGTATAGFVKDYLDEAWVLTYAEGALS